jgi:hypothetical protein
MSYQFKSEIETEAEYEIEDYKSLSPFEKHIIQCCKAPEWQLRSWLKKTLTKAGFRIIEDDYVSERAKWEPKYASVHNMLAIRGGPRVCLVAHSDICRDHNMRSNRIKIRNWGGNWWEEEEEEIEELIEKNVKVDPVVKKVVKDGKMRRIIQDRNCAIQLGADDRLGVAINSWIALNGLGLDVALYFPTDEEIGLKSAKMCNIKELSKFDLLLEVDRGNFANQLVVKIGNQILCSYETVCRLLSICYDLCMPRKLVVGLATDVYALKNRGFIKECCNITCGYYNSYSSNASEYIEISEAKDTMKFVANIVKDYYLNG